MKRLLYLAVIALACKLPAQSFPVKKVNSEYIVTSLKESEKYRRNIKEVIRDKNGLYWFYNLTAISSFDGVNWKSYSFSNADGRNVPVRINEIEVTDDGTIWLGTAEGMFVFNPLKEKFVPINEIFPAIKGMPRITNCIYKGAGNFLLISFVKEGFYDLNWSKGQVKHVHIDSINKVYVLTDNSSLYITVDKMGNYWGIAKENLGVWFYNPSTGEVKCSWKGEILQSAAKRLHGKPIASITYSPKDDALLISYRTDGILEKIYLSTGKSSFYTFFDDLEIRGDTNTKQRHSIQGVKIDPEKNEWVLTAKKYLVKLNPDISKCEYLADEPDLFPIGIIDAFLPETNMKAFDNSKDDNLLWIISDKGPTVLKERNSQVKQIPFEKRSVDGITPDDYINRNIFTENRTFQNIFFVRGLSDDYLILQQNEGRPKLLRVDKNFHITHALLNDKWKDYPAYFNPEFSPDNLNIAIFSLPKEPLDFRNAVIKDFRVNLKTMKAEEVDYSFSQRVWNYGAADASNVYWLFSNGYLYSFDPQKNQLDSIFICNPREKQSFPNRIKNYNFPTLLHKNSSTFWISFPADKELYKINLKNKKLERIFKSCLDSKDCLLGSAFQLYNFDSARIYVKVNMSGVLLNPVNDSITFYSDLFKNELPFTDYIGSLIYKNWLCNAASSEVNFQNIVTGELKRLSLGLDFNGSLSELSYAPPVNDQGEIILMSSEARQFIVFNPEKTLPPAAPGIVRFSSIRQNEKNLVLDSVLKAGILTLKYNGYNSIHFKFSDYTLIGQDKIKYEYTLYNGGDTVWSKIEGSPELTFTRINPGNYKLLIRATNESGEYSSEITVLGISILPLFTQTAWFIVIIIMIVAAIFYIFYRYRLQQIKKLQIIRNNIASDLHDDIGSTLNSISIYSEVARQQAGKEIPALDLIGINSRQIIENMSDIVWTINPQNDSFEKIIVRMRSFAYQLLKAKKIEFTFEADEKLNSIALPMQVRKNFYLVFKEAITNLVKYSGATRVSILLTEKNRTILLQIRDNGTGIKISPETQGNGLLNMKRRAEEINAAINIESATGQGTGIEMKLKI